MKKFEGTILAGLLALSAAGPALAHSTAPSHGYTDSNWSGQISVWGGSQLDVGWSGAVVFGAPHRYAPAYLPVRIHPAARHPHGAVCRHRHGHSHACCAGYTERHRHGHWKDRGRGRRH